MPKKDAKTLLVLLLPILPMLILLRLAGAKKKSHRLPLTLVSTHSQT